ncbi:MAG: tetratricopeptide repeat protein [Mariniblastus sp.]
MISQCPKCHTRLTDFAVTCEKCGWSIINSAAGVAAPDRSNPQASGTRPSEAGKMPTGKTPNGKSTGKVATLKSKPAADAVTEPPVIIVKNVAKTAPPPPPENRSTDDVLPPLKEKDGKVTIDEVPLGMDLQIQKAMDYIEQENYTSALSYLNRAIIDVPPERLAECFSLRGYVHLKNLDFVRAENDCTQAIQQNWEEAQTYAWRAAARGEQNEWRKTFDDLEKACELAGDQRDQYLSLMDSYSETASEYYREQIKAGNESADLFFERGWMYFRSGKYQKAERDFNHALKQEPHHPWASLGLARLRFNHNITKGVRDLCNTATHGDENCERAALKLRSQINQLEGNVAGAQRDLNRLLELSGGDSMRLIECSRLRSELGDHVKAIGELTAVLNAAPDQHLAVLVRGDCYRSIKNYSLAISDYSRYLRFFPEDTRALIRRAEMYLSTDRLEHAHVDLAEAMELDQTNFDAYLVRSKLHLKEEKLDQALTDCQKAVRLDNQQPEAFSVLAGIYRKLCDYSRAIEEYSRSVELSETDEDKANYLYHRGTAYYELEDFEKARKDFKKSTKLRPNHSGCWIWKAATCSRIEKWSDAIVGLQQAIAVRPTAADQYQKLGKPVAERAIVYFDRQQQRGHNTPEIFRQRGLAYHFLGMNVEAVRDYTASLEQEPDDAETLIRRGQVCAKMGNHVAAIQDFSKVIRKDAANHTARYCRAQSHSAQGKIDEARSDLLKSLKVSPNSPSYHVLLAELSQKVGDVNKTIKSLNKAILEDPTDPMTYRRRGLVHMQAQHYINAVSDFTHAIELNPAQAEVLVLRGQAHMKASHPVLAIEDFELALTHNDKLAKAYSGRAAALVIEEKFEYALIWLTKALHRFKTPREIAEIVFARGKVFFQMGRIAPAVSDFSAVIELMRHDPKTVAAARYARALANVQSEKFEKASKDFQKLLRLNQKDELLKSALIWIQDRSKPRPEFLGDKKVVRRPTRPAVTRKGLELVESATRWEIEPPYDTWVIRNDEDKEYGPVHYSILKTWIADGRVDIGMKILRADWPKWQRVEKIFSEISPVGSQKLVEDFPGIDVGASSGPQPAAEDGSREIG